MPDELNEPESSVSAGPASAGAPPAGVSPAGAALADAEAILAFWFGSPGEPGYGQARARWFRKDPEFDRTIAERFGTHVERALAGDFAAWARQPRGALARVLLLDQFPRNIFRGSPRAFAGDPLARAAAEEAVERGFDRVLPPVERTFVYLPFEHSESIEDQRRSLVLFENLAAEAGRPDLLDWARRHAVIIERFGRFPHRNEILGRSSTAEELEFLQGPGSSF